MRLPAKNWDRNWRRTFRARVGSAGDRPAWIETLEERRVLATVGAQMPDFQLVDDNLNSPLFGTTISPREYLQQVSGWYFIHTT
jgi:hypothetical protein